MADRLSLLIGGAIGFVSAVLAPIVVEPLKYCVFGPKLKVEFIEGDRGFITDTKENGVTDAHYVRVKVLNTGRQIAKQCRAYWRFRTKPATNSAPNRPLIPFEIGHRFRSKSARHSDPNRPPPGGVK